MRRTNITSHYKLPTLAAFLLSSFATYAQDKGEKDTNIICFAAQNKWVCAPEDKQHIANEKATKLIDENSSELKTSDVVIKSINIPKFDVSNNINNPQISSASVNNGTQTSKQKTETSPKVVEEKQPLPNSTVTQINDNNPYAKLWSHQLIGLSTPQSAINFVKQKELDPDEVLIIKSTRANMDWWIVLYGLYKDKQTGLDNEASLPKNIEKPWLRPLKNLKAFGFIDKF